MKHWPLLAVLLLGTLTYLVFTEPSVHHQQYAYRVSR